MLILCLEAGVSLPAALQRVTDELHLVHPLLGQELRAIEGQMRLGLSPAQALKRFGEKSGLIELRDLASILLQSEQTGASIVKALRAHADDSRQDRYASAQEHAQKTAVKILFPMLLCIFPAVFIVLLGPAAFQPGDTLQKVTRNQDRLLLVELEERPDDFENDDFARAFGRGLSAAGEA